MKTYALKQRVLDAYIEKGSHGCQHGRKTARKIHRSHWIVVATGLTWQDAKARRNASRTPIDIVLEPAQ